MFLASAVYAVSHPQSWPTSVWVLLLTGLAYAVGFLAYRPSFPKNAPKLMRGYPVLGIPRFFTDRGNFLHEGKRFASSGNWSFYYGKKRIVGLSGEDGRQVYFENRHLSLTSGYGALFNAAPHIEVEKIDSAPDDPDTVPSFNNTILALMRRERLCKRLPLLVSDVRDVNDRLVSRLSGSGGICDPFEDIYYLVFRLTMRMVGCDEIAEDEGMLLRMLRIFEGIDSAGTAAKVMFPWLPTIGHMRRVYSGTQMYMMLERVIKKRKETGYEGTDALQFLLDRGDSTSEMVFFIVGALLAGLLNSGINAAYVPCFLAANDEWYGEVRKEVDGVVERHRASAEESAVDVLARLSLEDWEAEFPLIDLSLKETIRHTITGCGFRYNGSGRDLPIGATGEVVPPDTYVAYHFDDTHMDERLFPEPVRWDPGRYLPGREEDKRDPHAWNGWGTGRHPCVGMRFAKLEIFIATAMFVATFDFQLCHADGTKRDKVPENTVNRNTHSASKPREKLYLKYTPRT